VWPWAGVGAAATRGMQLGRGQENRLDPTDGSTKQSKTSAMNTRPIRLLTNTSLSSECAGGVGNVGFGTRIVISKFPIALAAG